MTSTEKRHSAPASRKSRKWPWITIIILLLIFALFRYTVQTDWFFNQVRQYVERTVTETLHGEITIDRISGDMFSHINITGISLRDEQRNDVVSIDSIQLRFAVSELIRAPRTLDRIDIHRLRADLIEDETGWNLLNLLPEADPDPETEPAELPEIEVRNIALHDHEISVTSPMLPDEYAVIESLDLQAGISIAPEYQSARLDNLDFRLSEGRLDAPLEFASSAQLEDDRITLESLTIAGAHTLFESSGNINLSEEAFSLEALLQPLGHEDIIPYVEDWPVVQDLSVSLSSSGNFSEFTAGVSISAEGLEYLNLEAGIRRGSPLQLTSLSLQGSGIDAATLTQQDLPSIHDIRMALTGQVPINDWQDGRLEGELTINGFDYEPYRIDQYHADINWQGHGASVTQMLTRDGEEIDVDIRIADLFEVPDWETELSLRSINPAVWLADEELQGRIQGTINAEGEGFELSDRPIAFTADLHDIELMDERMDEILVNGSLDQEHLEADSRLRMRDGELITQIESAWQATPVAYSIQSEARNLDLSAISFLEELPSDLNFIFYGEGSGTSLGELDLSGRFDMARSEIDRRTIDSLSTRYAVTDTFLTIEDAFVESSIADGNVATHFHLLDYTDLRNRLDFSLNIKDLQPFAELTGAESLAAAGSINGNIEPNDNRQLIFNSRLSLTDIVYDTLYVDEINGRARSELTSAPAYSADLEILRPRLGETTIQDLNIATDGQIDENLITGDYRFEFNISEESGIAQVADYMFSEDDLKLTTSLFSIFDPTIEYRLTQPVDFTIDDRGINLDTMTLVSEDESTFSLSFSRDPDGIMEGHFSGERANLGTIQSAFMEEPVFHGLLDGHTEFRIDYDDLFVESNIQLTDFNFRELRLDLMNLSLNIADQRLVTEFFIEDDGDRLADSRFDLPFEPTAPEELDEEFFNETVDGYITIDPLDLTRFHEFMEETGIATQQGTLALDAELSGIAGSPTFFGDLILFDGALSGIEVDTVRFSWDYEHAAEQIEISSNVESMGQRVADIEGTLPFHADFQTFELDIPGDDDELAFSMNTRDFRMAAFSDFIPSAVARDLRGLLNADIDISGTLGDPDFSGNMSLSDGSVFLTENNIRISDIQVYLGLAPDQLSIDTFQMRSNGLISGFGTIGLDGFTPQNFDLSVNGRNFRAYGTRDIEAFVTLNTRFTGTMDEPRLSGSFRIDRGTIHLDDFGERTVEEVELDDEDDLLTTAEDIDFFERLAMEISISMDRNVFLRNRRDPEMNLALQGDLELVKPHFGELEIFGDLNIPSGSITTILNKRFDLDQGVISFSGAPDNPALDIQALYRPRQQNEEIRIWYIISGTVQEPEFTYDSEPEMEFQDIISYTLFGRPFEGLAGWERTVSGRGEASIASDLALDILLDRVEALAAERFGIDVIEIDNSRRSTGGGTSIKAGKFLSDRLFVAYLQELGGTRANRQVIFEYLIRSNIELILTASDDYRSGVDVLWRYDY